MRVLFSAFRQIPVDPKIAPGLKDCRTSENVNEKMDT